MSGKQGRVWAEIDLDNLVLNYRALREMAPRAEIMAAIKADAYGHGAVEVARTLLGQGVRFFGVASLEEGVELRRAGVRAEIIILSPVLPNQIGALVEHRLVPTVSDPAFCRDLSRAMSRTNKRLRVHVEVDTGMTRTGLPYGTAERTILALARSNRISIDGIFSHFPVADRDPDFSRRQIADLTELLSRLNRQGVRPRFVHIANTAGLMNYAAPGFNLMRPGIALYGLSPSPAMRLPATFRPVMSLRSRIVSLRRVAAGTPVSYGHTYRTKRTSTIATVSVGYGDGYPRLLSNQSSVICRGKRARTIGAICMDLLMVDVTHIPRARLGDTVTLIGSDGTQRISADECARRCNTIVYEITSGIGPRVARIFLSRGRVVSVRDLLGRWRNN